MREVVSYGSVSQPTSKGCLVNDIFRLMSLRGRTGRTPSLLLLLACLLVAIRLAAGFVCVTCFTDFEKPTSRSFHLHAGGDLNPCHHGRVEAGPLINWACTVTQDDTAFILPDVPLLPVVVSLFVPLLLLVVSYGNRLLIVAHGRSPPPVIA